MSPTRREFLGIVTTATGALLFAPLFNSKPAAALHNWADKFGPSDWEKNYGSAADGCSYPVVSYPSKVEPGLGLHLEKFRQN